MVGRCVMAGRNREPRSAHPALGQLPDFIGQLGEACHVRGGG